MFFSLLKRKTAIIGPFEVWGVSPRFGEGRGTVKKICPKCKILGTSYVIRGDLGDVLE